MSKHKKPVFTFQDLTPTLWRDSILRIFKDLPIKPTTLGWSLVDLERWLERALPDGEIFLDRISRAGWDDITYEYSTVLKKIPGGSVRVLKPEIERMLTDALFYYITNCSVHEMIHLTSGILNEPTVYYLTRKLLSNPKRKKKK